MMSGPELDREFKALLAAIRPLLPSAPQAALASSARWLHKLSALPPAQRWLRNQHLRVMHGQLAAGTIAPPFDSDPPDGQLSALPFHTSKQTTKVPVYMVMSESQPQDSKPAAGDASPRSDAKSLIDEAREMLRNSRADDANRKAAWRVETAPSTRNMESNDDEWSDISTTSEGGETCTSGDLALLTGAGHERCILLHRKHMVQLANQSAKIKRYETALMHFLDNPELLLGENSASVAASHASVTAALQQQLDTVKNHLLEAEREKTESQRSTRDANQQLQACQRLMKSNSENFTKQLATLNGKLQSYQVQMHAESDASARGLAAVNSELKACQLRLRKDAESFRKQLVSLNADMEAAEEESKRQLAARDKKARQQQTTLKEQMTREAEEKMAAAKKKISRLHKVIRRYDELKQQWSEEFEKKINRLQVEKDLQLAKVRLEMQTERASFPLTSGTEQIVAELEVKYQALARQHEEASWRQRQRDLRRISELERELEARSMHTGT